jgi:uncharacterized lipoprotein YddW (UPF0748 family)
MLADVTRRMLGRRTAGLCLAAAVLAVAPAAAPWAAAQTPEFRAQWSTRFEWPDLDPATCQANIDAVMGDLADAGFNAVFFQVRGQADVLYPSPDEVWSPLIGGTDPGWDPLAYAINAAHANGLELHAYINTHTCWRAPGDAQVPPDNPDHLFYDHCNAADPNARDWLIHDSAGNPVQYHESNYVWIAPGVPAFQAYIRKQIVYVVQNYDVDGVHFDRIRTPNSSFSYDPISNARRADPQSNPNNLDFSHWTRDQITRNVRDIYAAVMAIKPQVKVSAAVFPNPDTSPQYQHQDSLTWAITGGMDMLVPMMYFGGAEGTTWDTWLQRWLSGVGDRHVVAGQNTSVGTAMLLDQVALTRLRGGQGNSIFSYPSFTGWDDYRTGPYATAVATPAMPWKDSPTTGIIYGYVTDGGGEPVVDAQIARSGDSYIGLSTGDGFYSFLLVPPGTYTLNAMHPSQGVAVVENVTVAAGQAVRRDVSDWTIAPPIIDEVTPDPDWTEAGRMYTRQLTLAQSSATTWQLIDPPGNATISDFGRVDWMPTIVDVDHIITFTARAANAAGADDETWRVAVERPACTPLMLTDFEGYAIGSEVLFRPPRYSGSTSGDLAQTPNVAAVTDSVTPVSGTQCYRVQWQFIDAEPERWMRLTTHNADAIPNPTVALDRPIRFRLRVDQGGPLRVCVGVRETGTTADIGENGGTSGAIEWIGADTQVSGAPQGIYLMGVEPGVWHTLMFDPLVDPILSFAGGDNQLDTPTGKGTLEHIAFAGVDAVGPYTVYIDDVELLCNRAVYGDFDYDGDTDLADYGRFLASYNGPNAPPADGPDTPVDFDADGDVDLTDYGVFLACYNGPENPAACE